MLKEKVDEVAHHHGDQSFKKSDESISILPPEWSICSRLDLSGQSNQNCRDNSIGENFSEKSCRDNERYQNNLKLHDNKNSDNPS